MFVTVSRAGTSTAVSTIPAVAGPAFLTVIFSVKLLPSAALAGPLIAMLRSASLEAVVMITDSDSAPLPLVTGVLLASPL